MDRRVDDAVNNWDGPTELLTADSLPLLSRHHWFRLTVCPSLRCLVVLLRSRIS